jgi:hypothetical protein
VKLSTAFDHEATTASLRLSCPHLVKKRLVVVGAVVEEACGILRGRMHAEMVRARALVRVCEPKRKPPTTKRKYERLSNFGGKQKKRKKREELTMPVGSPAVVQLRHFGGKGKEEGANKWPKD